MMSFGEACCKGLRHASCGRPELILTRDHRGGVELQSAESVQMLWEIKQLRCPHLSRPADFMLRFGQTE